MSLEEEEVSVLWSKLPAQLHQSSGDSDCILIDSPPESPPRDKPTSMADSEPTTSSGFVGFSNIKLANVVLQQLDTPEDSDPEQKTSTQQDSAASKPKKKRMKKKKKKAMNPILVEKMIEQIKEAGVLERSRQRTESEDSTKYPRVKWQRYFESESPNFHSTEDDKPDSNFICCFFLKNSYFLGIKNVLIFFH